MALEDWKARYFNIRSRLLESTDVAYRLGFEAGMKAAKQNQMDQMQAQAAQAGAVPSNSEIAAPEQVGDQEGAQQLDSQIQQLESLVSKGSKPSVVDVRKAVQELSDIRKSQKYKWTQKSQANDNEQQKFINNVIQKWENESKSVTDGLEDVLKEHGFKFEDKEDNN